MYPGLGWCIFRNKDFLPDSLVFHDNVRDAFHYVSHVALCFCSAFVLQGEHTLCALKFELWTVTKRFAVCKLLTLTSHVLFHLAVSRH